MTESIQTISWLTVRTTRLAIASRRCTRASSPATHRARAKGSQNFKTLLDRILKEEISLQDGSQSRKISKAEAIMRRLIVGALKGESRDLHALFRLAEQTGQFEEKPDLTKIERVIVQWQSGDPPLLPANSHTSTD